PLNISFIWRSLPPVAFYQYVWSNPLNQIRNMLAGIGSTDSNEQSVFGAPFYDGTGPPGVPNPPGDYSGWLNTQNFQDTYFNPKFDQLYQSHTPSNVTMVTEVIPKTSLIKIEVGYLG